MPERPEPRYAKSGTVRIAYFVLGDGPLDLVYVPGIISHVDLWWEHATTAKWLEGLASFARLIVFDKRGTGASDRDVESPTLEERMDDLTAVMDAVRSEQAALLGVSEGGPMSILFAGTFPHRVSRLILYGTTATARHDPTQPWTAQVVDTVDRLADLAANRWGEGATLELFHSGLFQRESSRRAWARTERVAASASSAAAMMRMVRDIDVRPILPSLRVPTLVLHRSDDRSVPPAASRYLADTIPGAVFRELPGEHLPWLDGSDALLGEIEHFLTGSAPTVSADRVLSTVLFTDIVGSTRQAATAGDREWRQLLDRHDEIARQHVERQRGRVIKTTGDGVLATFDGPARAILTARAIVEDVASLGLDLRAGVHTGEIELRGSDVGGIAVHIGQRISGLASAGEILTSRTVVDLVAGSGIAFTDRGEHELKGVPGRWNVFAAMT